MVKNRFLYKVKNRFLYKVRNRFLFKKKYKRMPIKGITAFVLAHPDDETIVGLGYMARIGSLAHWIAIVRKLAELRTFACPGVIGHKLTQLETLAFFRVIGRKLAQYKRPVYRKLHFPFGSIEPPVVYYATLGEKGNPNGVCSQEELPEVRLRETNKSSRILKNRFFLDNLGDGQLSDQEVFNKLVENIVTFLEKERPDRVVTFAESGLTGHPDHIAISRASTKAVEKYNKESNRPIELYYRVISSDDRGITGEFIHHDNLPITHISKDRGFQRKKRRGIEAHATQVPEMGTIYPAFGRFAKRPKKPPKYRGKTGLLWKKETFHRVQM